MNEFFSLFWHRSHLEREHRLCRTQPTQPNAPSTGPQGGPPDVSTTERIANWVGTNIIGPSVEFSGGVLTGLFRDIPVGIYTGLRDRWTSNPPSREEAMGFISQASEFFRELPIIGGMIERSNPRDIPMLQRLVKHENWIAVFTRHPEVLDNADITGVTAQGEGPRAVVEFLRPLSIADRRSAFMNYVDQYLPLTVRQAEGVNGARFEDFSNPQRETLRTALGGVLGIGGDLPPGAARQLAERSARAQYGLSGANPQVTHGLQQDFQYAVSGQRLRGVTLSGLSADMLIRNTPPSRLLGALRLGVVNGPLLISLNQELTKQQSEQANVVGQSAAERARLSGETNKYLQEQAEGIREVWGGLGGAEKLILIGAAIWFARSAPKIAFTGVAAYFGWKFLGSRFWGGPRDPFEAIDRGLRRIGTVSEAPVVQTTRESEVLYRFMGNQDRQNMEIETRGLGVLARVPLNLLAENFRRSTDGGQTSWHLNLGQGSTVVQRLREQRENYTNFFEHTDEPIRAHNVQVADEALTYVFFHLASNEPANHTLLLEVQQGVPPGTREGNNRGLNFLPVGQGYPDLQGRPREAYMELVARGHARALLEPRTLVAVLGGELERNRPQVSVDVAEVKRALPERARLAGLSADVNGTVWLAGAGNARLFSITFTEVDLREGADSVIEIWKNRAVLAKQTALQRNPPLGLGSTWHVEITTDKQKVEYWRDGARKARADLIPFLRVSLLSSTTPPQGLKQRYDSWIGPGVGEGPDLTGL